MPKDRGLSAVNRGAGERGFFRPDAQTMLAKRTLGCERAMNLKSAWGGKIRNSPAPVLPPPCAFLVAPVLPKLLSRVN